MFLSHGVPPPGVLFLDNLNYQIRGHHDPNCAKNSVRYHKGWRLKWLLYAGIIAVSYGFLDEFLQTLIASRTGSIFDWVIDSTGALSTLGIIYIKDKLQAKSSEL